MKSSQKIKLGVLISGWGSNLQALIDAAKSLDFPAEIAIVLSNKPDAYGLTRAKQNNIPCFVTDPNDLENDCHNRLKAAKIDLVCLAGFMRILSADFINKWPDRLINIHPSLLPAFKGLNTHKRVLEAGIQSTGCTVHYVRQEVDSGPIILQQTVPVLPKDTEEELSARVLKAEHKCYPGAVRRVCKKLSGQ